MITIYYWPDGTWYYQEEYSEVTYSFKSDDFAKVDVSDGLTDDQISRHIDELVS